MDNLSNYPNNPSPNPFENFEVAYAREREVREEMEKIEQAYVKVVERYRDYADCVAFATYLKTIEKIFAEARKRNWNVGKIKDSLIEAKIDIVSRETGIGKDVLNSIYDDFRMTGASIGQIRETTEKLREKYRDNPECVEFILYVEYVFVNLAEFQGGKPNLDQMEEGLLRARMQVLSSDGNPEISLLEKIYKEFVEELRK